MCGRIRIIRIIVKKKRRITIHHPTTVNVIIIIIRNRAKVICLTNYVREP